MVESKRYSLQKICYEYYHSKHCDKKYKQLTEKEFYTYINIITSKYFRTILNFFSAHPMSKLRGFFIFGYCKLNKSEKKQIFENNAAFYTPSKTVDEFLEAHDRVSAELNEKIEKFIHK